MSLDAATLQRYVGKYRIGDPVIQAVMTVTLSGTQLSTQLTGQQAVEIYPQTATHFFLKVVDANLDFVTTGKGPATAMVLHQNGQNVNMPRIDDATAAQFDAKIAARMQSKTPQPGTQEAVSDWINRMEKGQPLDYTKMSPALADAMRAQSDQAAGIISSLGALQGLTFQGAEANGGDTFLAKFLSGSLLFHIVMDPKGIIIGFGVTPAAAP
ncbi:MAG TPA: DUF3471 domain-containing protein [Steroidobacteraceae bacterium]|nr:DUF3471 domain-containing protein [Steroidobacteraceae bacterium]